MTAIDATLPLSKHHQVYLVLLEQLRDGQFANGLPGELELARRFEVGRVTMRRALERLAEEGHILRGNGRRTMPAPSPAADARPRTQPLQGLLGTIVSASLATTVTVLDWRLVAASAEIAQALALPEGTTVRKIVRRRDLRAGPVSHITTYLPERAVRGFGRADLTRRSLLELLQESGARPGRAVQALSARQADVAVATQLQVPVGSALLWVRRLVHDDDDRPLFLLHGLYRPDRYEHHLEQSQVGDTQASVVARELLM